MLEALLSGDVISVAFLFLDFKSKVMWVVAQLTEHRTVTAAREGSTPFDPPKSIADWRLPIKRTEVQIGNWQSPIFGTVAER
jgi:hypothetical protein